MTRRGNGSPVRPAPEAVFAVATTCQNAGAIVAIRLFDEVEPATVAWLRALSAAVFLAAFLRVLRRPAWVREGLGAAALFGAVTVAMNTVFYYAIDRLPIGKGVTIEFIGPVAVAAIFTRSRRNSLALAAACAGVALLGGTEVDADPLGLALILAASALWAVYIVLGSRIATRDTGLSGLLAGLVAGGILAAPFGAPGLGPVLSSWRLLGLCCVVGLLSSAIGYGLDQVSLRRIPVRRFSVLLAMLPVSATLLGLVFLGQVPTWLDLAGMVLVLAGIAVQEREVRAHPAAEAAVS